MRMATEVVVVLETIKSEHLCESGDIDSGGDVRVKTD